MDTILARQWNKRTGGRAMTKEEYALDYCRRNCILIDGLYDFILDISWAPQIAVILHKVLSTSECERWGYAYFAASNSRAFVHMDRRQYYDMLRSTYAIGISFAAIKKGIGMVTDNNNRPSEDCLAKTQPIIDAISLVTDTIK